MPETPSFNITEYCLREHAKRFPDKHALIVVDKVGIERKFTYQQLYVAVCQLAAGFKNTKPPLNLPICS